MRQEEHQQKQNFESPVPDAPDATWCQGIKYICN